VRAARFLPYIHEQAAGQMKERVRDLLVRKDLPLMIRGAARSTPFAPGFAWEPPASACLGISKIYDADDQTAVVKLALDSSRSRDPGSASAAWLERISFREKPCNDPRADLE